MRIKLLGVNIDTVGRWEAMRILSRRLATGRQTAVYTPNPIMVRGAQKNELFRALLNRGDLMVADGIGILLGARLAGLPTPPRVAGIDLGEDVLAYAERGGLKVFLFGGKPGVADRAAEQLKLRFPAPRNLRHPSRIYFAEGERRAPQADPRKSRRRGLGLPRLAATGAMDRRKSASTPRRQHIDGTWRLP